MKKTIRLGGWIACLMVLIFFCDCKIIQDPYKYEIVEEPISRARINGIPTGDDGECFAKCLIADVIEFRTKSYTVFTGDESLEEVDLAYRKIIVQQKRPKWIKKKRSNCRSTNKDDCFLWCLVSQPEKVERLKILLDTTQSKNYEIQMIEVERLIEKGGYTDWKEVLCKEDITHEIIAQLQNILLEENFYDGKVTGMMDSKTKVALIDFQKFNNLPIGHLDLESFDFLGL